MGIGNTRNNNLLMNILLDSIQVTSSVHFKESCLPPAFTVKILPFFYVFSPKYIMYFQHSPCFITVFGCETHFLCGEERREEERNGEERGREKWKGEMRREMERREEERNGEERGGEEWR